MKGWKRIFNANGRRIGVAILISDDTDLSMKNTKRREDGHHIMIKGCIQREITIKVHTPNARAPGYMKQLLTDARRDTNSNTIIMEDLNTL